MIYRTGERPEPGRTAYRCHPQRIQICSTTANGASAVEIRPKCFACNGTFENRLLDIREVRLTPLSLCEASTAAIKAWDCWDSKSAPEILALTVKRHTTARTVSTRRTAAALRFNWYSLPNSTRTLLGRVNSLPRRGVSVAMTVRYAHSSFTSSSTVLPWFSRLHLRLVQGSHPAYSVALTPSFPIGAA